MAPDLAGEQIKRSVTRSLNASPDRRYNVIQSNPKAMNKGDLFAHFFYLNIAPGHPTTTATESRTRRVGLATIVDASSWLSGMAKGSFCLFTRAINSPWQSSSGAMPTASTTSPILSGEGVILAEHYALNGDVI
jgi:hypothetical protein